VDGDVINGRFRLGPKLGEGGMSVVYRAYDLQNQRDVALKILKSSLAGTSRKRFAREFRTVATVDHPNCIKVFDFGETSEFPFFTMEVFTGVPITSLAGSDLSIKLAAIYQATEALQHVHWHKIIHRDVKPSNLLTKVIDAPGASSVLVKLTDFGLARFMGTPSSLSVEAGFVGTIAYCAPEQISNSMIDHRVDLYSLGIVCYELLAGVHPFEEARRSGVQSLMRAQLAEFPARLRTFNQEIPREVDNAVIAYLHKAASERPSSLALLRQVIAEILGYEVDKPSEGTTTTIPIWGERRMIAREQELGQVMSTARESLTPTFLTSPQWLQAPIPSVVFITGDAGIGKSSLLREVAALTRRQGAKVFEGRCFEGNLAPFQPFVDIVPQMLLSLESDDSSEERRPAFERRGTIPRSELAPTTSPAQGTATLRGIIQDYSAELLRIAPELRQKLHGEAFRQTDISREANYVLRAVANFFIEVGSLHGTCLLIEDLHWADQSSLDLLRHLASGLFRSREQSIGSNLSFPRLFICCTTRDDQAKFDVIARELQRERYGRIVELKSFAKEETRDLLAGLLETEVDQLSPALVEEMHAKCQGNPFFISESVRTWRAVGRIAFSDAAWRLDESVSEDSSWPDTVRDVLRARLQNLSNDARNVLGMCAVIGSIIDIDLLRTVGEDLNENQFLDAVDELLARQILIEPGGSVGHMEFSHDLLRELTYEQLSVSRRRAIHRRIGETLEHLRESGREVAPDLLATHFYEAQLTDKAFRYLVKAGEAGLKSYAIDGALKHLRRAEKLLDQIQDEDGRRALFEQLGTAHSAAGRAQEGIEYYERLLGPPGDPESRARWQQQIGALYFRMGQFHQAEKHFDKGLEEIGVRRARSPVVATIKGLYGLFYYFLPRWLTSWRRRNPAKRRLAKIAHDILKDFAYLYAQQNVVQCLQTTAMQFRMAVRAGNTSDLAVAYSKWAQLFGVMSLHAIALDAAKRCLAQATITGDPELQAVAKGHVACAYYFAGRLNLADEILRESLQFLDRRSDSWVKLFFCHNLRHLYGVRGDSETEMAYAKLEMQMGEAVRDPEGTCWGAYGAANALARCGQLEEAHNYIQRALAILSGKTNMVVVPIALQIYGYVHLQSGNFAMARQVLEEARSIIEKNWAFLEYSARAYPLLVEAILGPNWHEPSSLSPQDIRHAWRMSRRARFWGWRFPNYWPHALIASARAAYARGNATLAIKFLERSIAAAESLGARYDLARAHLDLARISSEKREASDRFARDILGQLEVQANY